MEEMQKKATEKLQKKAEEVQKRCTPTSTSWVLFSPEDKTTENVAGEAPSSSAAYWAGSVPSLPRHVCLTSA